MTKQTICGCCNACGLYGMTFRTIAEAKTTIEAHEKTIPSLCVCITNNRQLKAAKALKQLGYECSDWIDSHAGYSQIKLWWKPLKKTHKTPMKNPYARA